MTTKQLSGCDACGQLAMCASVEVAPCVRRRICDECYQMLTSAHQQDQTPPTRF